MPKTKLLSKYFIIFIVMILFSFMMGFLIFDKKFVPKKTSYDNDITQNSHHTDAVIVLTGGMGRIDIGFNLLLKKLSNKMLITGVYKANSVRTILKYHKKYPESLTCCISLGYDAKNTRGNALETKKWMEKNHFKSLRLVTADYHMPRALMFFHRAMPEMEIIKTPVFFETNDHKYRRLELLLFEYSKYVFWRLVYAFF